MKALLLVLAFAFTGIIAGFAFSTGHRHPEAPPERPETGNAPPEKPETEETPPDRGDAP
jgi:hypothetical protein